MQNEVSEFVRIKLSSRLKLRCRFILMLFINGKKTGLQDVEEGAGQNQKCVQYANKKKQ